MKRWLPLVMAALSSVCFAQATQPATASPAAPSLVPGLVMDVYELPRMPTRLRRLIPGAKPLVSRVITSLRLKDKAAFGGYDEKFQMLLHGYLNVEQTGAYGFRLNTDDGSQLLIDGREVAINEGVHGQDPGVVGTVDLSPGPHAIVVRYFQADYGFGFTLSWKLPGADDFADVPADVLRADPADVKPVAPAGPAGTRRFTLPVATQPSPAEIEETLYHVCTSPGFGELNERAGDLLIALLDSPNQISERARRAIGRMLGEVNYDGLTKENQGRFLKGFMQSTFSFQTDRPFNGERGPIVIGTAKEMPLRFWNGRRATGWRTLVTIDGRDLTIDATKPDMPEVGRAALAVAGLPPHLRRYVHSIKIDPSPQNQYNGGGDGIWIRLDRSPPQGQIDSVFAHEIGHVLASNTGGDHGWQDVADSDYLSISGYGNRNLNEDFAEFTRLYLSVKDNPAALESVRTLFPKRYAAFMAAWDKSVAEYEKRQAATTQSIEKKSD